MRLDGNPWSRVGSAIIPGVINILGATAAMLISAAFSWPAAAAVMWGVGRVHQDPLVEGVGFGIIAAVTGHALDSRFRAEGSARLGMIARMVSSMTMTVTCLGLWLVSVPDWLPSPLFGVGKLWIGLAVSQTILSGAFGTWTEVHALVRSHLRTGSS